jgi:hypothetical protein
MLQVHATHKTQCVNNMEPLLRYDGKYTRVFFIYKSTHAAPIYGHPLERLLTFKWELKDLCGSGDVIILTKSRSWRACLLQLA